MKVVYILWLRQIKRYLRSRARMFGSLGQPLMFLIALGYGFGPIFQRANNINYISFLVPGIIAQTILFSAIFTGIEVIWDRQFGFLKETLVAPVSRFSIMLGRTLGGATVSTIQGILVLLISFLLGFTPQHFLTIPIAIIFMFIIALFFTALGTAIASLLTDFHGFQIIINFLIMPLFFLSGALFPLKGLPWLLMVISVLNPLTYGVDALRSILVNIVHFNLSFDLMILCLLSFTILVIGSYLFNNIEA
ncbi:MAG: ABC transporter permease [Candidatus Margulisbacteria bacterium]|nr:ABC transporter permease [Candidatus Margulisiibacteriota bacterium]